MAPKKRDGRAFQHHEPYGTLKVPSSPKLFPQLREQVENAPRTRPLLATDYLSMGSLAQADNEEQESLHAIYVLEESLGQVGFAEWFFFFKKSRLKRRGGCGATLERVCIQ